MIRSSAPLIGRYANRIDGGTFTLGRETHELAISNGPNHLHGGRRGFDKVLWKAVPFAGDSRSGFILRYTSPGEGYPGTLAAEVTYMLTDDNELIVDYRATADKATPVNITQHSCFNLAGEGSGRISDHRLMIKAEAFFGCHAGPGG